MKPIPTKGKVNPLYELSLQYINGEIDQAAFKKGSKLIMKKSDSAELLNELKVCIRAIELMDRARIHDQATQERWSDELKEEKERTYANFVIRERWASFMLLSRLNVPMGDE